MTPNYLPVLNQGGSKVSCAGGSGQFSGFYFIEQVQADLYHAVRTNWAAWQETFLADGGVLLYWTVAADDNVILSHQAGTIR